MREWLQASFLLAVSAVLSPWARAYDMTFEPPEWLQDQGLTDDPMLRLGLLDVTLYDGWEGHAVDPTGVLDSTAAIQQAITDARLGHLALFFPNQPDGSRGVYTISATLDLPEEHGTYAVGMKACNFLVGSKAGGVRPVLRLADVAPDFDDPEAPKAMLWFWSHMEYWEGDPISTGPLDNDVDTSFDQVFRGIDLDLSGHPGAIGIKNPGAQGQAIEDTTIDATGAFAGVGTVDGLGAGEYGVDVIGGRYGVFIDKRGETVHVWNGQITLVGFTFREQEDAIIGFVDGDAAAPVLFVGFDIQNSRPIPIHEGYVNLGGGGMGFVDGIIDVGGGRLFDPRDGYNPTTGQRNGLLLWNVYVRGAELVTDDWPIDDPTRWTLIEESWANPAPSWAGSFTNLVEGVADDAVHRSKVEGLELERDRLVASLVDIHRWDWETFPDFEDDDAVDARELGAAGDGVTDDWAVLQEAVNTHAKVLLPKGVYTLSQALVLPADVQLLGVAKHLSVLIPHGSWMPDDEAILVTTESSAEGTAVLTDVLLAHHQADYLGNGVLDSYEEDGVMEYDQFRFTPLEWRVGRNSVLRDVVAGGWGAWVKSEWERRDFSHFRVSGEGGGRWFSVLGRSNWGAQHGDRPDSRGLVIEGSDEPMRVYPIDFAWEPLEIGIEVTDSSHKYFYQGSFEGGPITNHRFTRSSDVAVFGSLKVFEQVELRPDRGVVELIDTEDAVVALYVASIPDAGEQVHLLEDLGGSVTSLINTNVGLYERGHPSRTPLVEETAWQPGYGENPHLGWPGDTGDGGDPPVDGGTLGGRPDDSLDAPEDQVAAPGCGCQGLSPYGSLACLVGVGLGATRRRLRVHG